MKDSPEQTPVFLGSYNYRGRHCGFELYADDHEDANARLAAICLSGRIDGKLMAVIPYSVPADFFVRAITFLRNVIFSKSITEGKIRKG